MPSLHGGGVLRATGEVGTLSAPASTGDNCCSALPRDVGRLCTSHSHAFFTFPCGACRDSLLCRSEAHFAFLPPSGPRLALSRGPVQRHGHPLQRPRGAYLGFPSRGRTVPLFGGALVKRFVSQPTNKHRHLEKHANQTHRSICGKNIHLSLFDVSSATTSGGANYISSEELLRPLFHLKHLIV